jgi:hypothetical protein
MNQFPFDSNPLIGEANGKVKSHPIDWIPIMSTQKNECLKQLNHQIHIFGVDSTTSFYNCVKTKVIMREQFFYNDKTIQRFLTRFCSVDNGPRTS